MIKKNKNNQSGEGEFDGDDFDEALFDEISEDNAEYDDIAPEDGDYTEENFQEDWDEEEPQASAKKSSGMAKQKSGLSFNTIVILGSVLVGGAVLAFNVITQTAKVESAKPSIFQSVLNIGSVMDGTLYGDKKEGSSQDGQPIQDAGTKEEGFLNSPETALGQDNPPQPSPITPTDQAPIAVDPLTPMVPDAVAQAETPRGPDDVLVTEQSAAPEIVTEQTETLSAKEVLEQAMGDRINPVEPPVTEQPIVTPVLEPTPQPISEPAPVSASVEAVLPEETKVQIKTFETKLDEVLNRLGKIETDIVTASTRAEEKDKSLETTLETLKGEVVELRARPAQVEKVIETVKEEKAAEKPVVPKAVKKAKTSKPKPVATTPWELRAAQPGRAWVSTGANARDVKAVTVGDTLSGIGKITGISIVNGRWVVQGSSGQIRQ